MRTVYKYPFHVHTNVVIEMPIGATILPHVEAAAYDMLVVWAEVTVPDSVESRTEDRVLHTVGTGHPMPDGPLRYIDTATVGSLVWHVYERVIERTA